MNRIMIAGTKSGCGKTMITCGILQALVNRKLSVSSYKCGPDYIDPMFHKYIIGTASRNLDPYFCSRDELLSILGRHRKDGDISVIEGVMGYFDGVGETASSYQVAKDTKTPVVLVIDCKGMSRSIEAVIKGFLTLYKQSCIEGIIFNRLAQSLEPMAKEICEKYNAAYLGRFPNCPDLHIESRHLGLVTANEIEDLKNKMQRLAALAEEYLSLESMLNIAKKASLIKPLIKEVNSADIEIKEKIPIAVAKDNAFCFYYEDNFERLKEHGAQLIEFSPVFGLHFPKEAAGLIIGGGYPELYLRELSENTEMLKEINKRINCGMPVIAECGGFMYLHKSICEGEPGYSKEYKMVGVIDGKSFPTKKLQRFGYVELTAKEDNLLGDRGHKIKAHEFHYWDSTSCGEGYIAKKASNGIEYPCVHGTKNMYAGFPHLYFNQNTNIVDNFLKSCRQYMEKQNKREACLK